jgi:branched-chain amino acid transport system ATP-binding protein
MLALARALMPAPKLLIADELSLGLAPIVVGRMLSRLRTWATESGLGVLLVEQQVAQALSVSDRAAVLVSGKLRLSGRAADLLENREQLAERYLGLADADD